MFEVLFSRQPGLFIPVLAIAAAGVVFVVWIIVHYWKAAKQLEVDAALKQDMLNRGMSAGDIERVLWASSSGPREPSRPPAEHVTDNEYYLVEKMLDDGRPMDEIERIVRAFRGEEDRARALVENVRARG
jgi:hypothetical protein